MRTLEEFGEQVFSYFYWPPPQILAVKLKQVERDVNGASECAVAAD